MKKIINTISIFCLSALLFSCSDIISEKNENNSVSDNKSLTVNMFMPDYSKLAENSSRVVSPATEKIRLYTLSSSSGKWTYSNSKDIVLTSESVTKTKVSNSSNDDFVPGYVYSFKFQDALSEGVWKKGTVRVALLDSDNNILSEGFNDEDLDLTGDDNVTAAFYTEPYSVKNSNNIFKNSEKAVAIDAGKMDFWYGYFVKNVTYTVTVNPTGSDFLDIAIFDEKGSFKEYKSVATSDESKLTVTPENDSGMYFGIYNKCESKVSYTISTTFAGEITADSESNYDNLLSDPSKWTIIDQAEYARPEIEDDTLYIPMSVGDSKYKTITYDFTVNKEMELVYDENTYVCPIHAGTMWIGVDGKGYNPSPNQIVEYITKRIHIYPGKHTFKITGSEKSEGQSYRHIVKNMQLLEIKENNSLDEDWSSGKIDKTFWSFRGREMPQIVTSIIEEDKEDPEKNNIIFAESETYGNFVKLVSDEISTSVQTNVNGSCSLILYNFTPSSNGTLKFDYFEDLGKNDVVTVTIKKIDSNNNETSVDSKTFQNTFDVSKKEGYGIAVYNFKDKTRNWDTCELTGLEAGNRYNIYWEVPKVSSTLNKQKEFEFGLTKAFYIDNVKFVAE